MAIEARFSSSAEAKKAGWFSRRHQTSEACQSNKATRSAKAKKLKRQEKAKQHTQAVWGPYALR